MESAQEKFKRAADTLGELRKQVAELKGEMKELASEYALNPSADTLDAFAEAHRRERLLTDLLRGVDSEVKRLMHAKSRELRARQDEASARRQERAERKRQREQEKRKAREAREAKREARKEELRKEVLEDFRAEHGRDPLPGEEAAVYGELRKRVAALD